MMRQRQDPYQDKPDSTSATIWIARLIVLFIVVTMIATAVIVLIDTYRGISGLDGTTFTGGNPNLNPVERLYLENYFASRTESLAQPIGQGTETTIFVIESGQHANQVADNLAAVGLLFDTELFINYVRYQGLDDKLAAGSFRLNPQIAIPELALALTQTQIIDLDLNFLTGWRLEEMAHYLDTVKPAEIEAAEFIALVQRSQPLPLSQYTFLADLPPEASLEGFLFPGAYRIPTDADAAYLITLMLDRFDEQVTAVMRQSYNGHQLTVYEAVILASIVQREAVNEAERPLIAGVFLNRLQLGMQLQADATVQYAIGNQTNGWWKSPLSALDLAADSPYNTYLYPALPPGPIANPGLSALQAVAQPQESDFIFFVADCAPGSEGQHLFSVTYEEHLQNVTRCRQ